MNICLLIYVGDMDWDSVGYTVAYHSFHNQMASVLCFVNLSVCFIISFDGEVARAEGGCETGR